MDNYSSLQDHTKQEQIAVSNVLDSVKLSCPLVFGSYNASDTLMGQNLFPDTLSQVIISN